MQHVCGINLVPRSIPHPRDKIEKIHGIRNKAPKRRYFVEHSDEKYSEFGNIPTFSTIIQYRNFKIVIVSRRDTELMISNIQN